MYVGFGYSRDQCSLDRYYSSRKVLRMFGKKIAVYVIPKRNLAKIGFEWLRVIEKIVEAPYRFLKRYFKNLSEEVFQLIRG